jgi:chromosome segregation ATPase
MTKQEILDVIAEVRRIGDNFAKSFEHLAQAVESMANSNADLESLCAQHVKSLAAKDDMIRAVSRDREETYSRAVTAETQAWEFSQQIVKLKSDLEHSIDAREALAKVIETQEVELSELRPFRHHVVRLEREAVDHQATVSQLRAEVDRLLEVILKVATTVDSATAPAKPAEAKPVEVSAHADTVEAKADVTNHGHWDNGKWVSTRPVMTDNDKPHGYGHYNT